MESVTFWLLANLIKHVDEAFRGAAGLWEKTEPESCGRATSGGVGGTHTGVCMKNCERFDRPQEAGGFLRPRLCLPGAAQVCLTASAGVHPAGQRSQEEELYLSVPPPPLC